MYKPYMMVWLLKTKNCSGLKGQSDASMDTITSRKTLVLCLSGMDPISIRVAWGRSKGNYCIQVSYNLLCSGQGELCAEKKSLSCYECVNFERTGWTFTGSSFYSCRGKVTGYYDVFDSLILTNY